MYLFGFCYYGQIAVSRTSPVPEVIASNHLCEQEKKE